MAKTEKTQSTKAGKYKIRPRAGEWGFLVRGKGKSQSQKAKEKQE